MKAFKFIIFAATATFLSIFIASCSGSSAKNTNNTNTNAQPSVVDVTTATAIAQNVPTYFEATGSLASDAQTDVAPTVGGKIV